MINNQNLTHKNSQANREVKSKSKYPKLILDNIFAFAPNRDTLGGTSYLILHPQGNILIDCPPWEESNREFCQAHGGVKYLFLTHRDGISKQIRQIHQYFHCNLIIQEQEAYLLPKLEVVTFIQEYQINDNCYVLWTPGYSPASSCLYTAMHQGILFSGRHILPVSPTQIKPLQLKKTFHWQRQLKSTKLLLQRFSDDNLSYILPGANTGYLRGQGIVDNAYQKLLQWQTHENIKL